ncbi:MAG: hypothetical protein R2991_09180 [Thermoanaerobaculia bacterium]
MAFARTSRPADAALAPAWLVLGGEIAAALLLAPFALLLLLPLMAIGGAIRAVGLGLHGLAVLPRRRSLEVEAEGVALSWSGAEGESEAALADGIELLLEAARRCGDVSGVHEVVLEAAPEVPRCVALSSGQGVGGELAAALDGRRVAYGTLVLDGGALRLAVEVDARSDRGGRLAVELPADRWLAWTRVLLDLAPTWGFRVRAAGLALPSGELDSAAA